MKTTSDPYVGRLSIVRVFSGTLLPDESVHVSGHFTSFFGEDSGHADHDEDEKIGALSYPFGKTQVTADARSSPATCARSAGSPAPRPATPSRRSTTRGC